MQVQAATQSTDHVQWAVAQALGLQHNQVNVTCRRAGGGFGGKFSRACPVAAAAAVAAHKLRRQVCEKRCRHRTYAYLCQELYRDRGLLPACMPLPVHYLCSGSSCPVAVAIVVATHKLR